MFILGLFVAIFSIAFLAIGTGYYVKKSKTSQAGGVVVAGLILGTLAGGATTVGTAQLAYSFGLSAMWYTAGSGLAALVLALVFVSPFRQQNGLTLVGMIRKEYGATAGVSASVLNSLGIFINILSQLISASAVVLVLFPSMSAFEAIAISAVFMALYVVFGGTKGAGIVGVLKLFLMYVALLTCAYIALRNFGGLDAVVRVFTTTKAANGNSFSSLFCRGLGSDLGACFSLILGVVTTQTYAQAVLMGRTDRAAKFGALTAVVMMPILGICAVCVGLYMRTCTDPTVFAAKTALTQFALQYLPPFPAGLVLGTLFIACVGTGAGLALGVSSIINRDLIQNVMSRVFDAKATERLNKLLICIVLAVASFLASGPLGDMILDFAYLSMGLRGCTVFAPLCFLIWAKGRVDPRYAVVSIVISPLMDLFFTEIPFLRSMLCGWSPLFPATLFALFVMWLGMRKKSAGS